MAVLGAVCRFGGEDRSGQRALIRVFGAHVFPSSHTHTHITCPCQCCRRRSAVILMGAECYFIPPLVTDVSGWRDEWRAGREGEGERECLDSLR